MSKLSLTLHTFSITGSMAGLFLTVDRWQGSNSEQIRDLCLIDISKPPGRRQEGTAESSISTMTGL